jgi:hypothetical protein
MKAVAFAEYAATAEIKKGGFAFMEWIDVEKNFLIAETSVD